MLTPKQRKDWKAAKAKLGANGGVPNTCGNPEMPTYSPFAPRMPKAMTAREQRRFYAKMLVRKSRAKYSKKHSNGGSKARVNLLFS